MFAVSFVRVVYGSNQFEGHRGTFNCDTSGKTGSKAELRSHVQVYVIHSWS